MRDDLLTMERRYGRIDDLPLDRLRLKQTRNRDRVRLIDDQIAELASERARLESENDRLELTGRALIDDVVERIRIREKEGWSPTAVVGYRIWGIDGDGHVLGATNHRWASPSMEATCATARPDDDLPHTDHQCSSFGYGCGIYAATAPELVDPGPTTGWLLGIVLLSGKVVEHEHGYRARHARVVAAVARATTQVVVTADPTVIEALFEDPVGTLARWGVPSEPIHGTRLIQTVEKLERNLDTWISETRSA